MKTIAYSFILVATLSSTILAQSHNTSHSSMKMNHKMDYNMKMHNNSEGISTTIMESMHQPMMEHSTVKSGNADKDFLSNMIPHHQGAILASEEVLKTPNLNPKIREIAENIIKAQKEEIKLFNTLLSTKSFPQTRDKKAYQNFQNQNQKAMDSMISKMNKVYDNNPQKTFLVGMIPHHEGAILASEQILKITNDPKIKEIANNIIKDQVQEIKEIEKLLNGME